jgi:chromosome segregation ATPase
MTAVTENDLKDLMDLIISQNQKIDNLAVRFTDLEKNQIRLEGKLENLETKLEGKLDAINARLDGQKAVLDKIPDLSESSATIKTEITTIKGDVKDIKGSQKAQIWTLIGSIVAAVLAFVVAVGRFTLMSFKP